LTLPKRLCAVNDSLPQPTIEECVASDGYRFRFRRWRPSGAVRGTIVALHGIQSHSGWYDYSSRRLCEAGWEVRFLDRRGSGMNGEARGHARHADRLVNDVVQALTAAKGPFPGSEAEGRAAARPVLLLGLSWGGRLATAVAARKPSLVDGLMLLYPAIFARFQASWWQRQLLRLARPFDVTDRLAPIPLDDPVLFTSDPYWQEFIRNDPVALHQATSGFFVSSAELEVEAKQSAGRISMPTLLMLAGQDRIIDSPRVREWAGRCPSADITVREFPDAAHTLEFEACRDEFVQGLIGWLYSRWPIHS
jgi:alpha-beta hydrolase superfamily lysophospholipase